MLEVSEAATLAFHAGAYLAGGEGNTTVPRLAAHLDVSESHLAKVLRRLGRAGVVDARRGPAGGYTLARPAADITLLDVYEAVEGPLREPRCLLDRRRCVGGPCVMGPLLVEVDELVRGHLTRTTLADVAYQQAEVT